MRNGKLLDAIGQVEDSLIEEAERVTRFPKPRRNGIPWKKWGGIAAALILVAGIGCGALSQRGFWGSGSSSSDSSGVASSEIAQEAESAVQEQGDMTAETPAPEEAPAEEEPATAEGSGSEAEDYTYAETEELLTDPPVLYVSGTAVRSSNYRWSVSPDETVIACGPLVLETEETITAVEVSGQAPLTLRTVETGLKSISAFCYPGDSWGNDQAEPVELAAEGMEITLPDDSSDWILVVTLTWETENYNGEASYDFVVHQRIGG